MGNIQPEDDISAAAGAIAGDVLDAELIAAFSEIAETDDEPPVGRLGQKRAAAFLKISRRFLRNLMATGRIVPDEDGWFRAESLRAQFAAYRAAQPARKWKRR